MHQSQTAVIERRITYSGPFTTEPFEAPWAIEARWFARVTSISPGSRIEFSSQISPDGLEWIDLDSATASTESTGLISWAARDFGHWLRLRGDVAGSSSPSAQVMIYLVLKG